MLSASRVCIDYMFKTIIKRNAGHSKWQNIRHIKAAKDAIKSEQFTKLGRQIKLAIQDGGSTDPKYNIKLEQILEQARRLNMPLATVNSVIKAASADKTKCVQNVYEIKGPGSCMILCEVYTSNPHHTKQNIASIIKKFSSKFADGNAKHMFQQKGIIQAEIDEQPDLEKATDDAIEAGAEDVKLVLETVLEFTCDPNLLRPVTQKLEGLNYHISSSSIEAIPIIVQNLCDNDIDIYSNLYDKLMAIPEVVKLTDNIA